jgi:hypothetical protein
MVRWIDCAARRLSVVPVELESATGSKTEIRAATYTEPMRTSQDEVMRRLTLEWRLRVPARKLSLRA